MATLRSHESLISSQIHMMRVGEAVTFTRKLTKLPVAKEPNRVAMLINSYISRRRPGCKWSFETFSTVSHAGNVHVGVIVTLVSDPNDRLKRTKPEEGRKNGQD